MCFLLTLKRFRRKFVEYILECNLSLRVENLISHLKSNTGRSITFILTLTNNEEIPLNKVATHYDFLNSLCVRPGPQDELKYPMQN